MRAILIGSVRFSRAILQAMFDVKFPIAHVFSLNESVSENVSGYYPIHKIAEGNNIPYTKFAKINDEENVKRIQSISPDYIFAVGLSQLIRGDILNTAKSGVIGFHPTPLPKMRGRAANVWQMLLGVRETACSMFFIDNGVDSGDILGQEKYVIEDTDYAEDVYKKIENALYDLSKRVLKQIIDGTLNPVKQNEAEATYLLRRGPEDGLIDWSKSVKDIHTFIRAVSHPFPGAFGMYDGTHKFIIWRAEILKNMRYIGTKGQIAEITDNYIDVVCCDGLLRVTEYENSDNVNIRVGHKLK